MNEPQFIRNIRFEIKWMIEDLTILVKHPTREMSWFELKHHWLKLWDHIIFHPWYCLKRGIRNLYKWFTTIWGNDCWDARFMQDFVFKQLTEMETLWREVYVPREREWVAKDGMEKGFRCQHRRIWKQIRWAKILLQMHFNEHYAMKWYDYHHSKFPERGFLEHEESETKYDKFGIPVLFTCKPMSEAERDHYRSGSDHAREMDEKVWKLYNKVMSKQRGWWD